MKENTNGFHLALGVTALGIIWFVSSVGALSQVTARTAPDGAQARSILELQPRHAAISVANLRLETDWYVEKLGFTMPSTPQMGGPNQKIQGVQLTMPGYQMHLIQYEGSTRAKTPSPPFLAQGYLHIAFSVADLDKAYSFLQAAGTDVTGMRDKDGKMRTLVLHDPEGNQIELFSR